MSTFYALLLKNDKGFYCKQPDGKIYFPAKQTPLDTNLKNGDVVKCETIIDKDTYGFAKITKATTEKPAHRDMKIAYNGTDWLMINENLNVIIAQINNEYITVYSCPFRARMEAYPYNILRDAGYETDHTKFAKELGDTKTLSWDDPVSKKLIINGLGRLGWVSILSDIMIKDENLIYVGKDKYDQKPEKICAIRINDELYFINKYWYEMIKGDTEGYTSIFDLVKEEVKEKHLRHTTLCAAVLPRNFRFKDYEDYDPEMDPDYGEYREWKEWANKAKKIINAKNASQYGLYINEANVFGLPPKD